MNKLRSMEGLFGGRHCDCEVIVLCMRWYFRYKLSLRDLVDMMAERGLPLAHTTIMRTITLDGYVALHRAVREMKAGGFLPEDTNVRSSTYLNNVIEQHNRNVKSRANVMLGFKRFSFAAVV